ncbi:MAG: HAD family hydrolase, partial [Deltaproteobacteria bacterium]|nr:HAD family hydrolase [Deltaproteobacteria bacterium]
MEMINPGIFKHARPEAVIFDFDGTISTLRQGWEQVMRGLMLDIVDPYGDDLRFAGEVDAYLERSAGIQTIYQMQWLAAKAEEAGRNDKGRDIWWYKDEYNARLMKKINERLAGLKEGRISPIDLMIAGSPEFLDFLASKDISLYVASGTDHADV